MSLIRVACLLVAVVSIVCTLFLIFYGCECTNDMAAYRQDPRPKYKEPADFNNFDNKLGTPTGEYIVPNIVHFIRFGNKTMTFMEAVCMLSALKNQNPSRLIIHTENPEMYGGKYWDIVMNHPEAQGIVEVRYRPQPHSIYGAELNTAWINYHASDIVRLEVLMSEGGIYLDGDSYVVKSLNDFRRYEMTLGWEIEGGISNQVIIAHKHARFLTIWHQSYKDYKKNEWYYNAGMKPAEILRKYPHLIHRAYRFLAEWVNVIDMVYLTKSTEWKLHYAIHLLINHQYLLKKNLSEVATYPVVFNETNILDYDANIKDMATDVYPFDFTHEEGPSPKPYTIEFV